MRNSLSLTKRDRRKIRASNREKSMIKLIKGLRFIRNYKRSKQLRKKLRRS
jgi:hypothetical protein